MLSRIVPENSTGSCATIASERAQLGERELAHVDALEQHAAGVDIVEPIQQRQDRRLAGARRPDERDDLARRDLEIDVGEHRLAAPRGIREATRPRT